MSHKRSKKALKNKIKQLEFTISNLNHMNQELQYSEKQIKERFRELGSAPEIKTLNCVPHVTAEIKPQAWGLHATLSSEFLEDPDLRKQVERGLVEQLVETLIKQEYVQFIHGSPDDVFVPGYETIAAKLFVFPWEKAVQKSIKLAARISKEDIDGESNPRT